MPNKITNVIIDSDENSKHKYAIIFQQLEELACYSLQLRYFSNISLSELNEILNLLEKSCILSIEILIPNNEEYTVEDLKLLIKKHPRITNLFIHSCKENQILINDIGKGNLIFTIQKIETNFQCGKISLKAFSINTLLFTESQAHNTCLNRKISIDVNGEIKNCPSMKKSFGNIKDTTLEEALEKPGFKDLWTIKKDDIEVCKDCEFRHICTDCRAFIKDPENIYSQPAKCPYNPYIAKWEGQEGYLTVEEWRKNNNEPAN